MQNTFVLMKRTLTFCWSYKKKCVCKAESLLMPAFFFFSSFRYLGIHMPLNIQSTRFRIQQRSERKRRKKKMRKDFKQQKIFWNLLLHLVSLLQVGEQCIKVWCYKTFFRKNTHEPGTQFELEFLFFIASFQKEK